MPAPLGPITPTMPAGGSENDRSSISSFSPKPLRRWSASITVEPSRCPAGMWIWTSSTFALRSSASSASYRFRRARDFVRRPFGFVRTHSSSSLIVRWRADSVFSSCASRFSFCSSHEE